MFLLLNSAQKNKTEVILFEKKGRKVKIIGKKSSRAKSDKMLVLIEKALKEAKISPQKIRKVLVASDPEGPWTAQRISQAIANAFGFVLKIPVEEVGSDYLESKINNN